MYVVKLHVPCMHDMWPTCTLALATDGKYMYIIIEVQSPKLVVERLKSIVYLTVVSYTVQPRLHMQILSVLLMCPPGFIHRGSIK